MSLRPRYSLLTLLVLTALVAGGVKLWHGPHHVVESPPDYPYETEYTFTRNWLGQRIVDGPVVRRLHWNDQLSQILIDYSRRGTEINWHYYSYLSSNDVGELSASECPLSAEELLAFQQVRDAEIQRLLRAGKNLKRSAEGRYVFKDR